MIRWDVDPEIFSIDVFGLFTFALRWYSLMFMLSFLIGIYMFNWIYKREGKPVKDLDPLLIHMLLGTIIGARLGHCFFYDADYYLMHPIEVLKVWQGGLASHGAAIGILIALYLYAKKHPDQPFIWLVDRMVIAVALAGSLIRLGNLFNSEILGAPTDVPWSFIFVRVDAIPRHPSQIYESLAYLLIFIVLFLIYKKKAGQTPRGYLFGLFLITVFGFRFFVEFVKEHQKAFEQSMLLNMGQILSIPLVIAGIIILRRAKAPLSENGKNS